MSRPQNDSEMSVLSSDVRQLGRFVSKMHTIWNTPLTIIFSLVFIYSIVGSSVVIVIVVMCIAIPSTVFLSNFYALSQRNYYHARDERVKFMQNTMQNIKTVKYMSAEERLTEKVEMMRKIERDGLRTANMYDIFQSSIQNGLSIAMFGMVVLINFILGHDLSIPQFFMLMNLFHVMDGPLTVFGDRFIDLQNTLVCYGRVQNKCLYLEKVSVYNDRYSRDSSDEMINCKNLSIRNDIRNANFILPKGQRACLVGPSGSGKSQLIEAILGFVPCTSDHIYINGSVAYASQVPFIQNHSIRENVLFGTEYDQNRYETALKISQLNFDLDSLPKGDQTICGFNGSNISGGQKQRISIARCVYSNRDLLILDGVFASLDVFVQDAIFTEILKLNKTILLVSENLSFASQCDMILMIKDQSLLTSTPNESPLKNYVPNFKVQEVQTKEIQASPSIKRVTETDLTLNDQFEYLRLFGHYFVISLGLIMLLAITKVFIGQFVLFWIRDSLELSFETYVGLFTCLCVFNIMLIPLHKLSFSTGANIASNSIHSNLFHSIIFAPISTFNEVNLIGLFKDDMAKIDSNIPGFFNILLVFMSNMVVSFVLVVWTSPWTILFVVVIGTSFIYLFYIVKAPHLMTSNFVEDSRGKMASHFTSSIHGIKLINIFSQISRFEGEYLNFIGNHMQSRWMEVLLTRWMSFRMEIVAAFFTLLSTGACIVFRESINYGIAALTVTFTLSTSEQLNSAMKIYFYIESAMLSVKRVFSQSCRPIESSEIEFATNWPKKGIISFSGVSLAYDTHHLIKDLSITFENDVVGIVGRTGSGKSTLFASIMSLITPQMGKIAIDGVDISKIPLKQLRGQISMIPQDPSFIDDTIRFNLDPFLKSTDFQIWKTLESLNLKNKLNDMDISLDDGIHRLNSLSSSEKHMIMFARALIADSKIVLLDEVNSSIDQEGEQVLLDLIKLKFAGKTVLIIAHNLKSLVEICNKVLVLDSGRIVEFDSPTQLLKNPDSLFSRMME